MASDEFGVGATSLLEQCSAESSLVCGIWLAECVWAMCGSKLTNVETLGYPRKIPYGLNSNFSDGDFTSLVDADLTVGYKTAFPYALLKFWNFHVSSGDGDGRSDLNVILVHGLLVQPWREMTVRVHGHNLLLVAPLWKWSNLGSRLSVGEVRLVSDVKVLACYSQCIVDGV